MVERTMSRRQQRAGGHAAICAIRGWQALESELPAWADVVAINSAASIKSFFM